MSSDEKEENEDVEIISTHDEKAKIVGEILSNDSSRKILNLLNSKKEMTINGIAQSTGLSLSLVTHHIKRMQSAEVIKISRVGRSVKGQKMNYYSATNQSFLIVPSKEPEKSITTSLKRFSRFFAIGMAGIVSWITLKPKDDAIVQSDGLRAGAPPIQDESNIDKWDSAYQTKSDEGKGNLIVDSSATSNKDKDTSAEQVREPETEPSHSGVVEFEMSEDSTTLEDPVRQNTGSVSLDRETYPVPYTGESQSVGLEVDPFFLSILIPIGVVVAGIVLERILVRWYQKRKIKD